MNPNISEFSYGYAITEETIQSGPPLKAAPCFPSLITEGQVGYDVFLNRPGRPLFLQFKVSHFLTRDNAKEIRLSYFPRGSNFYRIYLRPAGKSPQHQLLLDLEAQDNEVRYVAPMFHEPYELDDAYSKKEVRERSVFIAPSWVGVLPDDQVHQIAFDAAGHRHFLSDPEPPEYARSIEQDINFSAFVNTMVQSIRGQSDMPLRTRSEPLVDGMSEILSQQLYSRVIGLDRLRLARQETEPLRLAGYLSRTYFDCELLLVGLAEHNG